MKRYKIKDPTIKDKCKTEQWMNAVVYLLYENYNENPISILQSIDEEENVSLLSKIREIFEITNDINDILQCAILNN